MPTARYLGKYRKMHIPDDPQYLEKFYFTPGDLGFRAWDTRFGRIGVLVCWDQWYPEGARLTALHGAADPVLSHRHRLARAGEGRVRRAAGRRVGDDPAEPRHRERRVRLCGESRRAWRTVPRAASSSGAGASWRIPGAASWQGGRGRGGDRRAVRPGQVDVQRTHWPFLRDRRIEAYGDITKRFIDELRSW